MRRNRDLAWDGCLNVRDLVGHVLHVPFMEASDQEWEIGGELERLTEIPGARSRLRG